MTKPKKPPVMVKCVNCGAEVPKKDSCLWRNGRRSDRTCQPCASKLLRSMGGGL